MKKLLLLTKTLLAAVLLCVGQNAWGDATTVYLLKETFDDQTSAAWTKGDNTVTYENVSGSDYNVKFYNPKSGNRAFYRDVTVDYSSAKDGYTVEFDFGMWYGKRTSGTEVQYKQTQVTLSAGSDVLFQIGSVDTDDQDPDEKKLVINGVSTDLIFTEGRWYHFSVTITGTEASYSVTYQDSGEKVFASGSKDISGFATNELSKINIINGRNGTVRLNNVEISYETDAEIVSNPSIAVAYNGANRTVTITGGTSSKGNSVTTYYTTDGSEPTSSSSVYSSALDISSNCTVKAISISTASTASEVASQAVTVGKLTLNAPTFEKTGFSAGSYTYTIEANQSSLEFVPASTTIKYRVGSTGDFATYSSAVSVPAGDILYAYAEADNYTTSSTSEICAVALPAMTKAFGQNYVGVVDADLWMAVSAGPTVTNAKSTSDANYFIPSNDGGTSALTNENISFYFNKHSTDDTQDKKWGLKTTGMYADYTRGYANVKIENLTEGQIVEVSASAINSVTGLTELTTYSYGTTHYYVTTATTAYLNIARQQYVYSINVYDLDNEVVGAMDYTTPYYNQWNTTPIWINAGETAYYKFKNYNNGGNLLYQNWCLFGATEASENVVIFGPNHSNTGGAYTSKPTFTNADLNGATVELTTTLTDAGDGTYTLTTTGVTTKADGTTTLSPNLVYQQTGLTASKLKLYVSVDNSWLALQEEAVVASISSYGWATFSSENALDFSKATEGLEAYMITGHEGNVVTKNQVTGTVPAATGLLLKGDEGSYNIPIVASSETNVEANKLVAGTGASVGTVSGKTRYVLGVSDGGEAEFQKITETSALVAKGKAYLEFDGVLARSMRFSDDITGVENVEAAAEAQAKEGKFIENGKLVIVKNGQKFNAAGAKLY